MRGPLHEARWISPRWILIGQQFETSGSLRGYGYSRSRVRVNSNYVPFIHQCAYFNKSPNDFFFLCFGGGGRLLLCAGDICQAARIRRGHLGIDDSIKILYAKHGVQLDPLAYAGV